MSRNLRLFILPALAGVLVVLPACSGSDDSADKADTDATSETTAAPADLSESEQKVREGLESAGLDLPDDQTDCLATELVANLGEEQASKAFEAGEDLPDSDQPAVVDAFTTCIDGEAYVRLSLGTFYGGADAVPDDLAECAGDEADDTMEAALTAQFEGGEPPAEFVKAIDGCMDDSDMTALLEGYLGQSGVPEDSISCLSDAVAGEFGFAEFVGALTEGSEPPALTAAKETCAPAPAG